MTKLSLAALAAFMIMTPVAAMAADMPSAEQCSAWLVKADTNKDGALGKSEDSLKYGEMISKSSTGSSMGDDGVLKGDMFLAECAKGTFGMPST